MSSASVSFSAASVAASKRKTLLLELATSKAREKRCRNVSLRRESPLDPLLDEDMCMKSASSSLLLASLVEEMEQVGAATACQTLSTAKHEDSAFTASRRIRQSHAVTRGVFSSRSKTGNGVCSGDKGKDGDDEDLFVSEDDLILQMLGGNRDLYTSLMVDLEAALLQDVLEEEEREEQQHMLREVNAYEEQAYADVCDALDYDQTVKQLAEWSQDHEQDCDQNKDRQNPLECCSDTLMMITDDSCGSLCIERSERFDVLNSGPHNGDVMMCGDGDRDCDQAWTQTHNLVDYLVCPVCQRTCMEFKKSELLAVCRCKASLQIERSRHFASLERYCSSGSSRHSSSRSRLSLPANRVGSICLTIPEIKDIIARAFEDHRLCCALSCGSGIGSGSCETVTMRDIRLFLDDVAQPKFPVYESECESEHPHLLLQCSRCRLIEFVL